MTSETSGSLGKGGNLSLTYFYNICRSLKTGYFPLHIINNVWQLMKIKNFQIMNERL